MSPQDADPSREQDAGLTEDATLGGYFKKHERPPAFQGTDGQPYTVSVEVERTSNLRAPWGVYLVFPRWAETGLGIVGHVETPLLFEGRSQEEVTELVGAMPLLGVKQLLDEAVSRRQGEEREP